MSARRCRHTSCSSASGQKCLTPSQIETPCFRVLLAIERHVRMATKTSHAETYSAGCSPIRGIGLASQLLSFDLQTGSLQASAYSGFSPSRMRSSRAPSAAFVGATCAGDGSIRALTRFRSTCMTMARANRPSRRFPRFQCGSPAVPDPE